jgi:Na+/H+ antiporter NhaD/arsenite permease-like protein
MLKTWLGDWFETAVVSIFCLTYVLISARRLRLLPIGRPAGALLGALLMVAIGALSPEESYKAVDHDTILLLFGMMILTAYLERSGFFGWAGRWLLQVCGAPRALLVGVALASGFLSAFLVNDTVCLFLTPVVVATCRRGGLPMGPYLMAVATSANLGSASTLVGNPQNMIIGSMSGYGFAAFLAGAAPAALAGLLLNAALLVLYYSRKLPRHFVPGDEAVAVNPRRLACVGAVLAGVVAAFFAGLHLGYSALGGAVVLIVLDRRDPREVYTRVDWPLLVLFCSLFIVVAGLAKTGLADRVWESAAPRMSFDRADGLALFSAVMALGSNVVSNVPMVLLTGPHLGEMGSEALGWVLLAFTTTVAGNLTLIGSVANIIVAEGAREHYTLGFFEYLRFGAVSTLLVLAVGVPLTWAWMGWLG